MEGTQITATPASVEFSGGEGRAATPWRLFIFGSDPTRTLKRVTIWGVSALLFFHHMLLPIQIIGSSMAPTYKDGSYNFINKVAYTRSNPHMGDVIACETDGELILKRIIALPGDSVAIENGIIHINDKPLADNFARIKVPWEMDKMHLRENEFWVIGDNRSNSIFCKVHKSQIWGKIIF